MSPLSLIAFFAPLGLVIAVVFIAAIARRRQRRVDSYSQHLREIETGDFS